MRFHVIKRKAPFPDDANQCVVLTIDNWDDFGYHTQFFVTYVDELGVTFSIGSTKIGKFGQGETWFESAADIEGGFEKLDDSLHFSLGQSSEFYESLLELGESVSRSIGLGLNDLVFREDLLEPALREKVTWKSLLRNVSLTTVREQFTRLVSGGRRLVGFDFTYVQHGRSFRFKVDPESTPPSNVHAIIGANGVGKTYLMRQMIKTLVTPQDTSDYFESKDQSFVGSALFGKVCSVSFSAFDELDDIVVPDQSIDSTKLSRIGLYNERRSELNSESAGPKSPTDLAKEFSASLLGLLRNKRSDKWNTAIATLESDVIFRDKNLSNGRLAELEDAELRTSTEKLFRSLSSGHKIILLAITNLINIVEERTLVLIDEPESHLHPPLLSSFLRAVSELLIDQNGVAIVATHSPVVLQEIPSKCCWIISRFGQMLRIDRPDIETFGENVSVLTREAFGLEVTRSGFHRLLQTYVDRKLSYEQIVNQFDQQLGGEAKALLRAMVAESERAVAHD